MVGKRFLGLFAAAAVAAATFGIGAPSASAAIISLSDVAASISAPLSATGASFPATGTITNTGVLPQSGTSTLTLSATGGTLSGLPAGCAASGASAVCSVADLASGAAKSWTVTVTPTGALSSVTTTAVAKSALPELNVLPDSANNSASTATGVLFTVDAALSNAPPVVRHGNDTLLTASVTNTAAPQSVTVSVATGNVYDPALALPTGCSPANGGATVNCVAFYATGQTRSFDIAVVTPTSGNSITSTATATGAQGGSDSASVVTELFAEATAFVPQGQNLTTKQANHSSTFYVTEGSAPGLILDLNEAVLPAGTMCGAEPCQQEAAEALFPNSGTYSGSNPDKPFLWDISYGKMRCNDTTNEKCRRVVYYIPSGGTVPIPAADCATYGQATARLRHVDEVCVQNMLDSGAGNRVFRMALLRDIVIPILSGASGR